MRSAGVTGEKGVRVCAVGLASLGGVGVWLFGSESMQERRQVALR